MNPWSDTKVAEMKRLWREGKSQAEIAEALGHPFTRCSVGGKLDRLGIRPSGRANKSERVTRPNRPWTEDTTAELTAAVDAGLSIYRICRQLGIGTDRVRARMAELGIRSKNQPPTVTDGQRLQIQRLRRQGLGIDRIAAQLGLSGWVVRQESAALAADDAPEPADDGEFVARLLADGGMPRIVRTKFGPVLADANNRPWFSPEWWNAA